MSAEKKPDNETSRVLDNLVEFVASGSRPTKELVEDLQLQGGDPEKALSHFRQILSEHAPTWKEKAERERSAAQEKLRATIGKVHRSRQELEHEIRRAVDFLQSKGAQIVPAAYYRKFEKATVEDLESLLEDLGIQQDLLGGKKSDKEPNE